MRSKQEETLGSDKQGCLRPDESKQVLFLLHFEFPLSSWLLNRVPQFMLAFPPQNVKDRRGSNANICILRV